MTASAVRIDRHGAANVLVLTTMEAPTPGPGQVLIQVETAGVAYADVLMRRGVYPEAPALPFTPGYDVVGRVVAAGTGVEHVAVGTRVAALTVTGGYSTHALAPAAFTVPVPEHLRACEVSALVLNYVTAKQVLERFTRVKDGDTILVHGAAGGVGTALLELARHSGVTAIGSASGSRTAGIVARGAVPLDRSEVDVVEETLRLVPGGVTATFDAIGGPHLRRSRRATAPHGTVVSYGLSFAADQGLGRRQALTRHAAALARARCTPGAAVRLYVIAGRRGYATQHSENFRADLTALIELLDRGVLSPSVTVLPLGDASAAHHALEAGTVAGKLVLQSPQT